mmetsp:Transcript_11520/g.9966  ORF Transcript_11520/g.9966 Transcript_11520/m.9966 type:complete len:273 (-) Transcript_11520:29-847(-)
MEERNFMENDYVVYRDDFGLNIFFVMAGVLQCFSMNEKDAFMDLRKGDFYGELSLLSLTQRLIPIISRSFSVVAFLPKRKFDKIISRYPEIAEKMIKFMDTRFKKLTFGKYKKIRNANSQIQVLKENIKMWSEYEDKDKPENADSMHRVLLQTERLLLKLPQSIMLNDDEDDQENVFKNPNVTTTTNHLQKIKMIIDQEYESDDDIINENTYYEEIVEDDEIGLEDVEMDSKTSLRTANQKRQRRMSRLTLGAARALSKGSGFKVKWGVNIN